MASLSLRHIRKVFTDLPKNTKNPAAVADVSIDIADREFIVLVGPSGCGKTTTLRMIAGLEDISSGDLFIDGVRVNDLEPKDRDVAMVFQNYALYPHMTVYDNIAFALRKRIRSKDEIDRKVRETAELLDITDCLNRKPAMLSGGQQQRVAIGRAIVRDPKVMLMDEPLSNLDAKLRNQMRGELIRLRKKINTTFIYVTHDQTEAMTLGDRLVVMKDGTVQQIGTPQQVYESPANRFVAGFIGIPQMNFFDAELTKDGADYAAVIDGYTVPLTSSSANRFAESNVPAGPVTIGVRPDSLVLGDEGIEAEVDYSELMGSSCSLHLNRGGSDVTLVAQEKDENNHLRTDYTAGSRVRFGFAPQAMYFFDRESGESLTAGGASA